MLILCVKGPGYVSSLKFKSKSEHMVLCIVFFFFQIIQKSTGPPEVSNILYTDATSIILKTAAKSYSVGII